MPDPHPRILFIGLDAAEPALLRQWAAEGLLPNLALLLDTAAHGRSRNPPGLFVGAVWASFFTGLSPAGHGRYCHTQFEPGGYGPRRFESDDLGGEPFWQALDRAGRRVAVIDIPHAPPSPGFAGVQVANWCTHDPDARGFFTSPPSLAAEMLERFGSDPVGDCDRLPRTPPALERFRRRLLGRIALKERLVRWLLARGAWDLLAVCFADAHCVGHQCWHLHDPSHDRYPRDLARALGDPVCDIYAALDAAVGRLVRAVPPETIVLVLADLGMAPQYDGNHLIVEALKRINAALMPNAKPGVPRGAPPEASMPCFKVPNNAAHVGIRFNVAGRERHGWLKPGQQLEGYRAALIGELLALTDGEGRPVFRHVLRIDETYDGPRLAELPDLVADWVRSTSPIEALVSATVGRIEGRYEGRRTGDHTPEGLYLLRAPGIATGAAPDVDVVDFAPMLASLLGVRLEAVDGTVPPWLDPERIVATTRSAHPATRWAGQSASTQGPPL